MKIRRNTLDLGLEREREQEIYSAIANRPIRENRKIQDWERFKQFVKQHQEKTQQQLEKFILNIGDMIIIRLSRIRIESNFSFVIQC